MGIRRTGDKRKAQMRHAKLRALERYDLDLRNSDIENIVKIIQKRGKDCKLLDRQSNTFSVYQAIYKDCEIKVIYDHKRKSIATFLPKDADYSGEYYEDI